jgi:hypothetical protein
MEHINTLCGNNLEIFYRVNLGLVSNLQFQEFSTATCMLQGCKYHHTTSNLTLNYEFYGIYIICFLIKMAHLPKG